MPTLYQKYRPQNFTEVVGQNHIKITLEQEIKTDKIAHAYLFCGPRAVGKTTLARVFTKAINCEERKGGTADPCNNCLICQEITYGRALDILEIDAASNTGVDNVRDNIIAGARVAPSRSKYKVFIIDEVHMLSAQAFNALLKVIEEPPARVVFILCTTEAHKVPATIISRCQRFDFKRIGINDAVKKLVYVVQAEKVNVGKNILEAIARQADGHMRDAESLLGQIIAIGGADITQAEADLVIPRSDLNEVINLLEFLIKKDAAGGIRLINKLIDDGVDLKTFVKDTIGILRKLLLMKINPALANKLSLELGETLELKINKLAPDLTVEQTLKLLERFIKVSAELKADFIQQLSLEMAIAEICTAASAARSPLGGGFPGGLPVRPVGSEFNQFKDELGAAKAENKKSTDAAEPVNFTNNQIQEKWNEVLAKVKQYNHSLSFILRVCQPRGLNGRELTLAFKYKFHKDRVSEIAIKNIIEKVLREVYGAPVTIEAVIDENLEVAANKLVSDEPVDLKKSEPAPEQGESASAKVTADKQENMIDNLLKTFGGKIVS